MRAMVLNEYSRPLVLEERPVPNVGPGDVLVRVRACGMCGTDLKIADGKLPGTRVPLVMGHEPAGEVVEVGSGVTGLAPGDRVVVHFYVTCGQCEFCRSQQETVCPQLLGRIGFELDGGYADYLVAPARNLVKFPSTVPFEHAAILGDAVGTAFHAVKQRARVSPEQTVVVMGCGGVGLHVLQVAKAFGARVIAVDINQDKLELSKHYGADEAIFFDEDYVRKVLSLAAGKVDCVIETVGLLETLTANLKVLRPRGRLVIIGYAPGSAFPVNPLSTLLDELEILGSRACTKEELAAVVDLTARGLVRPVVTRRFPLEETNHALDELRHGRILGRAVIVP
ncbi:MAG: alcohol dehydrogenase catalytic domain-containing protein [Bacillota bacterium]